MARADREWLHVGPIQVKGYVLIPEVRISIDRENNSGYCSTKYPVSVGERNCPSTIESSVMPKSLYSLLVVHETVKKQMICGVCRLAIPLHMRKEHLRKYHKIDSHLIDWIIHADDELVSLTPKNK